MDSQFLHQGDVEDDGLSSAGSSSFNDEISPPDGMTEEESLQIWHRRSDEIWERRLREQQQEEEQQQPLGSGDPGANPFPSDEPALRDAHLQYQQFLDLNRPLLARLRRQQELEQEARRREREATEREREATQRLEEAIRRREALEQRAYVEAPAVPQYYAPLADQGWEYERLLEAQYALTMAVQENEAMRREEEAHQRRMRAANEAMQREEEEHQRLLAHHHHVRPDATSINFAIGGEAAARAGPQDAAPFVPQGREYDRLAQSHYAMASQANDAMQREEEAQQRRMRAVAHHHQVHPGAMSNESAVGGTGAARVGPQNSVAAQAREYERLSQAHYAMAAQVNDADSRHRPPTASTVVDKDINASSDCMNDSASNTTDYSNHGDNAMKDSDGAPKTNAIMAVTKNDNTSRKSTNNGTSSTTAIGSSGNKDKKPKSTTFGLATAQENDKEGEKRKRDTRVDALVDAFEEKMMDLWDYGLDNEGMEMS